MKKELRKSLLTIAASLGVITALVGCSSSEDTKAPIAQEEKKLDHYKSDNYGVQFDYPSGWIENEDIAIQNSFPTYFTVSMEDQADFYYFKQLSFEGLDFSKENIVFLFEKNGAAKEEIEFLQDPEEFTVDGKTAHEYTVKYGSHYMYQAIIHQSDKSYIVYNHRSLTDTHIDEVKEVVRTSVITEEDGETNGDQKKETEE